MSLPMTGATAPSSLDPDGIELATLARRWLGEHAPMGAVRAALEADAEQLPESWTALVDLGWIGLAVPESCGGQGATLAELAVVVEEWGRALAPGPFPTTAMVAMLLGRFAPDLVGPILGGAPAAASVGVGALAGRLGDDGGISLSGTLGPIDGGALAEWFLLPFTAGGDAPEQWCVVAAADLTVTPLRSTDPTRRLARVTADGVRVPIDRSVLCTTADVERLAAVVRAAECVGVASWCVHTAATYAADRVQFGRPIGQFQAVKHRCADALCRLEAARAVTWDAAGIDPSDAEFAPAAAAAGALASGAAFECAKDAIQVLGGIGYTWEHDAHLYLRRATAAVHLEDHGTRWRAEAVHEAAHGTRRSLHLNLPPDAEALRAPVKEFLDRLAAGEKSEWNREIADGGWIAPYWPEPWGRGADGLTQLVIDEEFRSARIRRPHLAVAGWVLPTLIGHGTSEQQEQFIRTSLRQEITWCQLFSEPGAGSDLASLTTRAERVDGGWSLSGQKVWTTMADRADWGICLARTDPDAPKHEGITCFLVDMKTPGLDIRPLKELTGFAMFNEVFLDGVFVPDEMLVGAVNNGWACARTTLENERVSMASGSSFGPGVEAVLELARQRDRLGDARVVDEIGSMLVTSQALGVMGLRTAVRAIGRSVGTGPEASVRKLMGVEHEQRVQELAMSLLGPDAAVDEGEGARWFAGFLGNRALSIAGGTSEIQRNVIGERLLGLPKD